MDDEKLVELVSLYLDGELTGARRWRRWQISRKLGHCEKTQTVYEIETTVRHVLHEKCQEPCPEELQARIASALGLPTPPDGWFRTDPPPHGAGPPVKGDV